MFQLTSKSRDKKLLMSRFEPKTFHLPLFNGTLHFALYKIASSFFNVPSECSRWKFLRMHLNRNAWMFWIFSRKSFTRKFIWEFDSKWFNFWCAFCHNFFGIFTCIVFEKLLIFSNCKCVKPFLFGRVIDMVVLECHMGAYQRDRHWHRLVIGQNIRINRGSRCILIFSPEKITKMISVLRFQSIGQASLGKKCYYMHENYCYTQDAHRYCTSQHLRLPTRLLGWSTWNIKWIWVGCEFRIEPKNIN